MYLINTTQSHEYICPLIEQKHSVTQSFIDSHRDSYSHYVEDILQNPCSCSSITAFEQFVQVLTNNDIRNLS